MAIQKDLVKWEKNGWYEVLINGQSLGGTSTFALLGPIPTSVEC